MQEFGLSRAPGLELPVTLPFAMLVDVAAIEQTVKKR